MGDNPNISPSESLQIISKMIHSVKKRYSENGFLYLLWGWAVFFCSLAQFILLHFFQSPYHGLVWMLTWVVLIYQVIYLRKKNAVSNVRVYTDAIIGYVWISFVVMLCIFSFQISCLSADGRQVMLIPGILALYGLPVFLCGIILRFKPLIIGGICCWVLSVLAVFVPYEYQVLLISLSMLVAWIWPGYSLRQNYKEENDG